MKDKFIINKNFKSNSDFIPLLLVLLLSSNVVFSQNDTTLERSVNALSNFQSGILEVNYKIKRLFNVDTVATNQNVMFYFDDRDSLYNNILFKQEPNTFVKLKDEYIYIDNKRDLVFHKKNVHIPETKLAPYIHYFSKGKSLSNLVSDSLNNVSFLGIVKIKEIEYFKYKIQLPNETEFSNIYFVLFFNTETFLLTKIISNVEYLGENQYEETSISPQYLYQDINSSIYDSINNTFNTLHEKFLNQPKKDSTIKKTEPIIKIAPSWSLPNVNGDTIHFQKIKSKLILLDFWYVSCSPCLKAIPALVKLDSLYNDDFLNIIGVNAFDKKVDKIQYIIEKFNINYDIVYLGIDVAKDYGVKGYPKLFLIDTETKEIIHYEKGYNENLKEKLEGIINEYL